jgi:hypothetical protein
MEVNYWAILICGVLSMVVGAIWYGPLFGRKWCEIVGVDPNNIEGIKKMQKESTKLYVVQFILTLFQVWVLAYYIEGWKEASGLQNALWIWVAFVMPIIAGTAMWNNDSKKIAWTRFLIQSGYQLVIFIIFGLILGFWK